MKLSEKGQNFQKFLFSKLCKQQPKIYIDGTFEFENLTESDADDVISNLTKFNYCYLSPKNNSDRSVNVRGMFKDPIVKYLNEDIEYHDELNPKLWDKNDKLLKPVKIKLIKIVSTFQEELLQNGIPLNIIDIYLVGSNANYNYTDESDLDVHIIADESMDESEENFLDLLYNAYKVIFNSKYDITIHGIDVELYVEDQKKMTHVSSGVYSLKDGWLVKPSISVIPNVDTEELQSQIDIWNKRYEQIIKNPSILNIDILLNQIYELRQMSVSNDGEFGIGNLVFKDFRNNGKLQKLKDLKVMLKNKELSI